MTGALQEFIETSFRTVWSLELLLFLHRHPDRTWSERELVGELRSSDVVVAQSVAGLITAGLVVAHAEGGVAYAPASPEQHTLVDQTDDLYRRKPGAVRRAILRGNADALQTFADAFKLRKD